MNLLRCLLAQLLVALATLVLIVPMTLAALLRPVMPLRVARRRLADAIEAVARAWLKLLLWTCRRAFDTRYEVTGSVDVDRHRSYVMISNHRSWVDVLAILEVFGDRLPFYRFFVKRELVWMPLIGVAFLALDFPLMRRRSSSEQRYDPESRGSDLWRAKRACDKLQGRAVTMVNFPEGRLFRQKLHAEQGSPHDYLLKPRAGGTSLVLSAMADQIDSIIDVTIDYPDGAPKIWHYLFNRVPRVRLHLRQLDPGRELMAGDYRADADFRARFQDWINRVWHEKDRILAEMRD